MKIGLNKLRLEQNKWATKNFGASRPSHWPLIGAFEELGELAHAHLKWEQGIRGTAEEHEVAAKDAFADTIIYLCDYATRRGWKDIEEIIGTVWNQVKQRDWKKDPIRGQNASASESSKKAGSKKQLQLQAGSSTNKRGFRYLNGMELSGSSGSTAVLGTRRGKRTSKS